MNDKEKQVELLEKELDSILGLPYVENPFRMVVDGYFQVAYYESMERSYRVYGKMRHDIKDFIEIKNKIRLMK